MINWDDYRFFLELERQGAVARAARALGVDMSTVRRRLQALEAGLGARLFQRRREGVVLTPAGQRLAQHVRALEATTVAITRQLGDGDRRLEGTVRLSAGEAFVSRVVAPALGRFLQRHPLIRVELAADNQRVDVVRGEADVALRLSRPTDESLVGKKIATLPFGLYAAPAYLARAGRSRHERDLAGHLFVGYDTSLERTPETQWLLARAARLVVRCNSPLAIYAVAAGGAGIAAVATLFGDREPGLERILPALKLPAREVWLVTHRDLARVARVRALQQFLAELLATS
jgi:DNA-binding transcriptional LysR family regulator